VGERGKPVAAETAGERCSIKGQDAKGGAVEGGGDVRTTVNRRQLGCRRVGEGEEKGHLDWSGDVDHMLTLRCVPQVAKMEPEIAVKKCCEKLIEKEKRRRGGGDRRG
jgi:hypothetical protein